ncbi:hypothetical protein PR202_gb25158 [Eleusine coracana subsp. coracana]|uniref:Protein kinase domain-containing protein n=1 Tax=Eleusine coracana subsp. coracana TaxID=191504 RepID=A0AAV5FMU9_ELECO|nr:hypothetical protein PR202_gb25158 [Eleusine coracana subsp. coracana]
MASNLVPSVTDYGGLDPPDLHSALAQPTYPTLPLMPCSCSSLVVAILPAYDFTDSPPPNQPMAIKLDSLSQNTSGSQMGSCKWPVYGVSTGCVQIPIDLVRNSVECFMVYDPLGKRLSVSIGEAARNPDAPYAVASSMALDLSAMLVGEDHIGQIGLFSSIGQLAQLQTWNLTVDRPLPKDGSQKWVIILSSVLGSVAATTVMAAAVYCYLNSKYRRWKKDLDQLAKTMQSLPGVPTQVDFAHIKKATNNFHETMKLGRGGFGAVYGCTLPAAASRTGQPMRVAVKKFTRELTDRRYEDFLAEVSIINRLRHKNVVPLVGWSYNKGEPLLIYEYMKNGSLDQRLFQRSSDFDQGRKQQDTAIGQWVTRYRIARDIAMGLQYLHHEHEPMVLHRDIKASNIMLDSDLCARLGDFGISCTVDAERSSVTGVAGTIGYMGPEYVVNYKATRQTDIFAFGVVILEIVTGKKNMHVPADDGHITQWVRRLHREGALLQALDDKLIPNTPTNSETDFLIEEAQRLLLLGLACTNPNPSSRPSMTEVLQVINKLAPSPDMSLEQPSLGLGWISEDGSSVSSSEYGLPAADHSDSKTKLGQCNKEQRLPATGGGHVSIYLTESEVKH